MQTPLTPTSSLSPSTQYADEEPDWPKQLTQRGVHKEQCMSCCKQLIYLEEPQNVAERVLKLVARKPDIDVDVLMTVLEDEVRGDHKQALDTLRTKFSTNYEHLPSPQRFALSQAIRTAPYLHVLWIDVILQLLPNVDSSSSVPRNSVRKNRKPPPLLPSAQPAYKVQKKTVKTTTHAPRQSERLKKKLEKLDKL